MSTPTTNLNLPTMDSNPSAPETIFSQLSGALDEILGEPLEIDCAAGGTITVTDNQWWQHGLFYLKGAPAADFILAVPHHQGPKFIVNRTGKIATIQGESGSSEKPTLANATNCKIFVKHGTFWDVFKF